MRFLIWLLWVGILFCWVPVAQADEVVQVAPNTKVRIKVGERPRPVIGRVVALDDDALLLRMKNRPDPTRIERDSIDAMSVSAGRHSRGRGALIGAGGGLALGAVLGLASPDPFWGGTAGSAAVYGTGLGMIGALVGLVIPPAEKWERVDVSKVRIGFLLDRRQGVGVTVGF